MSDLNEDHALRARLEALMKPSVGDGSRTQHSGRSESAKSAKVPDIPREVAKWAITTPLSHEDLVNGLLEETNLALSVESKNKALVHGSEDYNAASGESAMSESSWMHVEDDDLESFDLAHALSLARSLRVQAVRAEADAVLKEVCKINEKKQADETKNETLNKEHTSHDGVNDPEAAKNDHSECSTDNENSERSESEDEETLAERLAAQIIKGVKEEESTRQAWENALDHLPLPGSSSPPK